MPIEMQFVDFPKAHEMRDIVQTRFEKCLDQLQLAKEIHLNLVFKHVHFTITELRIMVTGDKIHESIHVSGNDIPHTIEKGVKKLHNILHKMSDKSKAKHHSGRERRGRKIRNDFA